MNFRNSINYTEKLTKAGIIKQTLLIFLPFFVLMLLVAFVFITVQNNLEKKMYQDVEENIIATKLEYVQEEISYITSDLLILTLNSQMDKFWKDSTNSEIIEHLTKDFLNLAICRKVYDQVRLINKNGSEIIRINFNNGNPEVVTKEKLQNKKNRYYFYDAFKLNKGEIFVSPLDLNIEHGEIEQPLKPMIRIATPVFDQQGIKQGIVLLNYLGQNIINRLDKMSSTLIESQIMLLNADGYWLKGEFPEHEWGFMYEDRKNLTFKKSFPVEWAVISKKESSQFETPKGLFTFKTIHPAIEGYKSSTGSGKAYSPSKSQLNAKDYHWKIVSYVPANLLYEKQKLRRKYALILLLFLSTGLFYISRRLAKTQQALQLSNITKDKFFSIIAHDLKSPFNTMLGFSQLLIDKFEKYDVQKQKKFLGILNSDMKNTYKLLENLLMWSQTQRGTIDFNPEKENLYTVVVETIRLLNQTAENKEISIKNKIPENTMVRADKDMLATILRNLLSNAIKFTPKAGIIEIGCLLVETYGRTSLQANTFLEIYVKDSGVGIPKEKQNHLFNISKNTSTKGTEKEEGTGLGLILCKEFVEKHGGKIWVESEKEKGSKFIFTIPA